MWLSEAPEWSKSRALHSILDLARRQIHRTIQKGTRWADSYEWWLAQ